MGYIMKACTHNGFSLWSVGHPRHKPFFSNTLCNITSMEILLQICTVHLQQRHNATTPHNLFLDFCHGGIPIFSQTMNCPNSRASKSLLLQCTSGEMNHQLPKKKKKMTRGARQCGTSSKRYIKSLMRAPIMVQWDDKLSARCANEQKSGFWVWFMFYSVTYTHIHTWWVMLEYKCGWGWDGSVGGGWGGAMILIYVLISTPTWL